MTTRPFSTLPSRAKCAIRNEAAHLGLHVSDWQKITPAFVAKNFSARELFRAPNCGHVTVQAIAEWLAEAGLCFRDYYRPSPPPVTGEYHGA